MSVCVLLNIASYCAVYCCICRAIVSFGTASHPLSINFELFFYRFKILFIVCSHMYLCIAQYLCVSIHIAVYCHNLSISRGVRDRFLSPISQC